MKIQYESWNPGRVALGEIERADAVCAAYAAQGYDLTLRQLYYVFVSRGWIPNSQASYKRLGSIINQARLAGLLDWNYIVDRTRNLAGVSHWRDPNSIIDASASSFRLDKWADQPRRVEIWVEKEALAGVIGRVATETDVDYFSCRGYVSQSEQWAAGQRLGRYLRAGQPVTVLHLGDHDPSGIDMSRDITDRLTTFVAEDHARRDQRGRMPWHTAEDGLPWLEVRRIALNMDQIEEYQPPPNPAKLSDSRAASYVSTYGDDSWELDALPPEVLDALIREHIDGIRDNDLYDELEAEERRHRELLSQAADRWDEVVALLEG